MGINRKNENTISKPYDGITKILLTGKETGSKMLSVNQYELDPGSKSDFYEISNVEESIFVSEGQVEFRLGNNIFTASQGDAILAKKGQPHGFANSANVKAIVLTVSPNINVDSKIVEESQFIHEAPTEGYFDRSKNEPYEFTPGVMRYDMVGDFIGAESTCISELICDPNGIAPNHYHPKHEESMYCLEGKLNFSYAKEDDIILSQGDMFTCEVAVRHGFYNAHKNTGRLLAIHSVLNPPPRVVVD
tara:strand:+ start:992 stop:1732 length:741 start_codon:yes stop_codon:yes gene_type:complete